MSSGIGTGSNILNRMMLAFRAGLQFHGKRNLYEVFGYQRNLYEAHLYAKYQRQDIVSRIVNMPPEEMWSLKPTLKPFAGVDAKWDDFVSTAQLWDRIIQADKLCCFGKFSVLLFGLPGNSEQPAMTMTDIKKLLYVQAYGGDSVRIDKYEDNPANPRFGQPLNYQVRIGPVQSSQFIDVHYSRIVHIVDRPLQGQMFSEPRLAQVYNILEDMTKVVGGSAELFWIMGNRGMQVDVDKDMELGVDDANALTAELDEFQHGLRRYIRTRGVKIENLGSDSADPSSIFDVLMSLLAATTSIPQRILMGSEVGQLASEQDRANWSEYIERRRTTFGGPYVLTPILQKLVDLKYLPEDSWKKAQWEWPEAFHMNPVEKSNTRASNARAIANLSRRNQFGNPVVSDEEVRTWFDLPEKPKTGDTMPEMPEPKAPIGGPASSPNGKKGVASVTDAPSAIANTAESMASTVESAVETAASAADTANSAANTANSVVKALSVIATQAELPPKTITRKFRASRDPKTGAMEGEMHETIDPVKPQD